jgi:hypothetical protein
MLINYYFVPFDEYSIDTQIYSAQSTLIRHQFIRYNYIDINMLPWRS